jgi:hypothetical protein
MESVNNAVAIVSGAFLVFAVLCTSIVATPLWFLLLYLFCLKISLVWMLLVILKKGTPSKHTFDEKFYEDQ